MGRTHQIILSGKWLTIDGYGWMSSSRAPACGPTTATLRPLGSGSTEKSLRSKVTDSRLACKFRA
jgi:hypothetical protein|eukprot:COSAG02_NODE_1080_length_14710_cov_46.078913_10_plen_65_part_00